jgi:hypothetical protein
MPGSRVTFAEHPVLVLASRIWRQASWPRSGGRGSPGQNRPAGTCRHSGPWMSRWPGFHARSLTGAFRPMLTAAGGWWSVHGCRRGLRGRRRRLPVRPGRARSRGLRTIGQNGSSRLCRRAGWRGCCPLRQCLGGGEGGAGRCERCGGSCERGFAGVRWLDPSRWREQLVHRCGVQGWQARLSRAGRQPPKFCHTR